MAASLLLVWSLSTLGFIIVSGQVCPPLNLLENMATEDNIASVNISSGPISVNVTCGEGYVLASGETTQIVECYNVEGTGEWGSLAQCQVVSCDSIPSMINAHVAYADTVYGSVMSVSCASGRARATGEVSLDLVCDASGQWTPTTASNYTSLDCIAQLVGYRGCFQAPEDLPVSVSNVQSLDTCIQHCRGMEAAIAALSGSDCYCGNLAEFGTKITDKECNSTCGLASMAYCGGAQAKYSLFAAFDGCYVIQNSTLFDEYVEVGGRFLTACLEYCRGLDALVAMATKTHRCKCMNETAPISAAVLPIEACTASASQLEETGVEVDSLKTVLVQRLDPLMHPRTGDTCEELFNYGIMLHGFYYTSDTEKEWCQFVDGTVCDPLWVGFEGRCYHFSEETGDFNSSQAHCQALNSHLLSVASSEEHVFVKYSVEKFARFRSADDVWYLGMYDSRLSASFQWTDGSLVTYSNFAGSEPRRPYEARCVAGWYDEGYLKWYDQMCDEENNYICKKNDDLYFGCIEVASTDVAVTIVDPLMTTVECRQSCLVLSKQFSAVHNQSCYCMDTPPAHVAFDWTSCDIPCPGNEFQFCGGSNVDETKSTIFVTGGSWSEDLAEGCDELEQQGLTEGTFLTTQGALFCTAGNEVVCPFSWINLDGNCYKFLTASTDGPCYTCADQGGYLASILDQQELTRVRDAIQATRTLRSHNWWAVGLTDQNQNGVLRWSNGQFYNYSVFERIKTKDKKCHVMSKENRTYQFVTTRCAINENPFICEKGSDYKGCYPTPAATPLLSDYPDLTLAVCVERCRGEGERYALVNLTHCWCDASLDPTSSQPPGKCGDYILNEKGQQAGGPSLVSAYDVHAYAPYAESCEDLFTQGIMVPGMYSIGGQPTFCSMADNTTCPTDSAGSWLGVGLAGYCLMFDSEPLGGNDAKEKCRARGGVLASVGGDTEWNFLIQVIRYSLRLSASKTILIGVRDEFLNGLYSWADGSLMKHGLSDLVVEYYNMSTNGLVELNATKKMQNQQSDVPSSFMCSSHRDYEGCHEDDGSMIAIAEFTSMTLTLCRQLCLGQPGQTKALLHTTKCYCTTQAVLNTLTPVTSHPDCDVSCQGHSGQSCATGSKLRAYNLETENLAENCTELYTSGVLYKGTYLIQSPIDTSTSLEQCGFEVNDRTCAPGWLAHGDTCLQVFPRPATQPQAADFCFQRGGYLFTPKSPETFQFISSIINAVPQWSRYSRWRTGAREIMQDGHLVLADGMYLNSEALVTDVYFNDSVVMDTTSEILLRDGSLALLPFVCEHGDVLSGCEETDTSPGYSQSSDNLMSVSQCMETCRGQPEEYAEFAVRDSTCECYTSHNTVSTGSCTSRCPAHPTQQCGNNSTYSSFYSIAKYNEMLLSSCTELYMHGVVEEGWYYILYGEQQTLVQCFNYGAGYGTILGSSAGVLTASSEEPGHPVDDARLNSGAPVPSSWIPTEEPSWIKIDLPSVYLVKAIFLQGGQSVTDQAWVETIKIEYTFGEEDWITYTESVAANSARSSVTRMFLSIPLVCERLRLTPLTSHVKPSLRVELLGQLYGELNHTDRYVGCFKASEEFTNAGTVSTLQQCIDLCSPSHPFIGLVADTLSVTCYCGTSVGQYGQVDSSMCDHPCGFSDVTCSSDTDSVVAAYRAYDIGCPAISSPSNSTSTVTKVYEVDDVNTFQTEVTYTCETGFEFTGGEIEVTVTCLHTNQWDQVVLDCQVKHCDPLVDVDHTSRDSNHTVYNSRITYTCETGYVTSSLSDSFTTVCLDSKNWTVLPEPCTPRPCAAVPEVQNAVILENNENQVFGDTLTYQCHSSSKFSDDSYNKTTSCGADGEWSPLPASCTYYECPSPPHVPGADVTHDGGLSATYTCIEDYEFDDGSFIVNSTCNSSFIWSPVDKSCIPTASVKQRGSSVCLSRYGHRIVGEVEVTSSRSAIACGVLCLQNTACRFYNFNPDNVSAFQNCQLFVDRTSSFVFAPDSSWNAYMLGNEFC